MVQTYSYGKYIYSVDMMFSYINIFKPKMGKISVSNLLNNLDFRSWQDNKHHYSPNDVLANPKKYKQDMDRIKHADMSYPIIMHNGNVVDGVHRLTRAVLDKKRDIPIYEFNDKLMAKFLINTQGDIRATSRIKEHELIELFTKRFMISSRSLKRSEFL